MSAQLYSSYILIVYQVLPSVNDCLRMLTHTDITNDYILTGAITIKQSQRLPVKYIYMYVRTVICIKLILTIN